MKLLFSDMPKGWMAEIVRKGCRFGHFGVNSPDFFQEFRIAVGDEFLRQTSRKLGHFVGMGESIVEDLALTWPDNLCNSGKPA